MKIIKSYVDFSKEYSLNENLIKKSWMKIQEFFRNKYRKSAWIYYALFLKKSNKLPKNKIEIILPSNNSLDKMTEIPEKKYSNFKFGIFDINEKQITLQHPDPSIENLDVDELVDEIVFAKIIQFL